MVGEQPAPLSQTELKCLADNVWHEARGESFEGKVLVARTTLNRVLHPNFPKTICGVVYQPHQFSWTKTDYRTPNRAEWVQAANAVYSALYHPSPALYFHAVYVKPTWAKHKQLLQREGNHIFYK